MRLIDADALLRQIDIDAKRIGPGQYGDEWRFIETIEKAPTIDAEPVRHGRWIEDRLATTSGGTYGVRRCSLCEASYQDVGYGWDYCPECGARMDGGSHEDD